MPNDNSFELHKTEIIFAAGEVYRAEVGRSDIDPDSSRVYILPADISMLSDTELRVAELAQARLNVAARAAGKLAFLQDRVEAGGFDGLTAKLEIGLRRVFERKYTVEAMRPGGVVDTIRGVDAPTV